MVGQYHKFNGHEFEQASGDGGRYRSLGCCCPWGHKESDTTEQLNNSNNSKGGRSPLSVCEYLVSNNTLLIRAIVYWGEGNGNPLQHSCLGNFMDRGAWETTVYGVTKESDTT